KPIAIFYKNLLRHGVKLAVVDGQLRVGGDLSNISGTYRDEIVRRKEHLIDLLGPPVPEPLQPYIGKVILLDDAVHAIGIANQMEIKLRQYPVQGGWLLFMPSSAAEA